MTSELPPPSETHRPRRQVWRGALGTLLLAASIALTIRTVLLARQRDSINQPPSVESYADPVERGARLRDALGRFATGSNPGDRVIVVLADGRVRFELIGPLQHALEFVDTYTIGRRDGHTCLVTKRSGVIDAVDIDHLSFCGNDFDRTQ